MIELIRVGALELAAFLDKNLPGLSENWWQALVIDRLSFQQQRLAREHGFTTLTQLDFAALLRALDQNWYQLSDKLSLPREGRNWVRELQSVRNKWAHLSAQALPPSEVYRDADTFGRFLDMLNASPASRQLVDTLKSAALQQLAAPPAHAPDDASPQPDKTAVGQPTMPLFPVGALVALRSNPAQLMPVLEVLSGIGEYRYRVFHHNAATVYYESQLQAAPGQEDSRRQLTGNQLQAYLTSLQLLSPSTTTLFSLRSGRVTFVPYQYRPVLKLIRADRPRLLIADEVGVGKTIEAGLVIKELRARMDLASVLIICPKALVAERKWFWEMKRFDEQFEELDGPRLRHCLQETDLEGEWPERYARAIVPFSLFNEELIFGRTRRARTTTPALLNLDPPPRFDLVIVDEAHHIRNPETFLHQGVRYFCDQAQAVLFLTATPVQLGSEDLYTLLNVLRPDLVIDQASFGQMAEPNRFINKAVRICRAGEPGWARATRLSLDRAAHTEWGRLFLRETTAFQAIYDRLQEEAWAEAERVALIRPLEQLYTFSRLINRTRRRDIGEFTTRKPETVTTPFTPTQQALHDDLLAVMARILAFSHGQQNIQFMMSTIRRQAASCLYGLAPLLDDMLTGKLNALELMLVGDLDETPDLAFVADVRDDIHALLRRAQQLDPHDPKVEAFIQLLRDKNRLPDNKALVFSTFRHTLTYLARHVERAGLRYGLVHGAVADEARADLRRRFALPKEDAAALDVLLSSEVGCEGLDFQFCNFLINYDLPWNPMRIEQRIGRIDRYGQRSPTVAIINFITPDTVDADIYERCLWRIGIFQHAVGGNEAILGAITRELRDIAERFDLTPEERAAQLRQLADNGIRQIQEEQELEARQAELFGLNVPGQTWRQEIEAAESYWLSPAALQRCVTVYLAQRLGAEQEYLLGEKPLKTLRLSQEARARLLEDFKRLPRSTESVARAWEKWLKGGAPHLAVTFDQTVAAENPQAVHLSVTHPLTRQAAQHWSRDEVVYTALTVHSATLPPGDYVFGIYRWQKQGVRPEEALTPVASRPEIEADLFTLLQTATVSLEAALPESAAFEALDAQHYHKWWAAQANHSADNRQQVERRIHSLTVSHTARCRVIEDQLNRATNDKIRLMKHSELARANADFQRRLSELERSAESGDIHAAPVVFGQIVVEN